MPTQNKSLPFMSATEVTKVLKNYGSESLILINTTLHSILMIGKLIKALFPQISIKRYQSSQAKHQSLSVLTAHYDSASLA